LGRGRVKSVSEEFRKNADTCNRLAAQLRTHEHQNFARDLAAAWIRLAEQAELAERGRDVEKTMSMPHAAAAGDEHVE
jgi:hypothetical protein